ncbi:MAG: AAA family ATPase, partial [Candidatus Sumerlaeota bacterium]|nr:AAA family ATPase [Candidatus Sumerlaeota bacterium]
MRIQKSAHQESMHVPQLQTCRGDVFVGRLREIKTLLQALQDAREGFGGIVLLLGEPGIGKTRTAEEFAGQARGRGATVLWGRCHEGEEPPPYGPWTAALRPFLRSIDAQVLRQSMGEGAADIAQILPELRRCLGGLEPPARLPTADGEQCLFSSLVVFLRTTAQGNPLVVILDNLHLADPGSLKFLRHLAAELAECRLLIVGTCRNPEETRRDPLAATLEELAKTRRFQRLHLDGLGRDEVREFLRRSLPGSSNAQAEAIHARTEGNPLFIVELVRQMLAGPEPDVTMQTLPEGIRQAIGRRLGRLPPQCITVLQMASVLGQSFDQGALLRMVDEARGDDSLGALEVARSARLHLRAAQAIRQVCGSDPGPRCVEILDHLLEAADAADPADLLECALKAADQVMARYAPDQALAIIDRTCATWERLGRSIDPRMARILHLRGRILTDLQRPKEARDSLRRAFDLYLAGGDAHGAIEAALTPAMEKVGGV